MEFPKYIIEYNLPPEIEYVKGYPGTNEKDKEFFRANLQIFYDFLQEGYRLSGLGAFDGFPSRNDMKRKCSMYYAAYYEGKLIALSVHNSYIEGFKCVGMTAVHKLINSELHEYGITALYHMIQDFTDNWSDWCWIEADGAIAHMYKNKGAFAIPADLALEVLSKRSKPLENTKILSDGYQYTREMTVSDLNSEIPGAKKQIIVAKTMFGFNSQETYEKYLNFATENFAEIKKVIQNNVTESRRPYSKASIELNKEYSYLMNAVEDFQTNEYTALPTEYFDMLQKSIDNLQDKLQYSDLPLYIKSTIKAFIEDGNNIIKYTQRLPKKAHNLIESLRNIGFFERYY